MFCAKKAARRIGGLLWSEQTLSIHPAAVLATTLLAALPGLALTGLMLLAGFALATLLAALPGLALTALLLLAGFALAALLRVTLLVLRVALRILLFVRHGELAPSILLRSTTTPNLRGGSCSRCADFRQRVGK